jgi:hypothetical protein
VTDRRYRLRRPPGRHPGGWVAGRSRLVLGDARRIALVVCGASLLAVAWAMPLPREDVIDSVEFSIAFFATLLTGEAVIFALSFAASSAWPSFLEIDGHIAFREWVITGWLGSMLTATGLLVSVPVAATCGALLFLLADVLGMFSFIRLLGLASASGRKRLLGRTLGRALAHPATAARGRDQGLAEDAIIAAYLGQVDQAAARSDGGGVRDLADELAGASVKRGGQLCTGREALALHLEVVHRLAKAALVGTLDPVVASSSAATLISSLLARISPLQEGGGSGQVPAQQAAAVLGQASRYLAWLASTSLVLSTRQVTAASAARELVAFSVGSREQILRLADPDPPGAAPHELGTPLKDAACVLAWLADFTEFHGSHQAAGLYPAYEILTGEKFLGNYWDGDSVLGGLRNVLFSASPAQTAAAEASRAAFGAASEFDLAWTLMSVGAIATLRDVRLAHPPELIRPEFTPDHQLLGAYLRTFAAHRYFATTEQAMTALTGLVARTGAPGSLWPRVRSVAAYAGWTAPMPVIEPRQRLPACVMAVAIRLAPLAAGEPDRHLRSFLAGLPLPVLEATARLAVRALPDRVPDGPASRGAAHLIASRLRVIQLVGTHAGGDVT